MGLVTASAPKAFAAPESVILNARDMRDWKLLWYTVPPGRAGVADEPRIAAGTNDGRVGSGPISSLPGTHPQEGRLSRFAGDPRLRAWSGTTWCRSPGTRS